MKPKVTNVTSDTEATKISQANVSGNQNFIHFVTPKGTANSKVTLTATLSQSTQQILNDISWEGATESASNPLQATVSKDTASKNIVKIKYKGSVIKELRVWVVWSTITSRTGLAIRGGYRFNHTIEPASIITDANRPNFSGTNVNLPPGGNHPFTSSSLSGWADKKWDVSRQMRAKILNPANINGNDFLQPPFVDVPSYPSDDVVGNDDANVLNEVNDPYANNDILTDADRPIYGIVDRPAMNGDTFVARLQFQQFTRIEIEGT